MKKIHPERYQGIEYLRLSSLPIDQLIRFKDWLGPSEIVTIKTQHGSIQNCVHYFDYEFWFDNYKTEIRRNESSLF